MIDKILDELSLEDLVGQVLCYDISDKDDPAEIEKIIQKYDDRQRNHTS